MSDHRPHGILKRKERDSHYPSKRPPPPRPPPPPATKPSLTSASFNKTKRMASSSDSTSNKLLAGYMAYEFLTKGTVLGEVRRPENSPANIPAESPATVKESYMEVTRLMMTSGGGENNNKGVCISGVVNPTQVARWIKM